MARQRRIRMGRQSLTFACRKFAGARVDDAEPLVVDLIAVNHADVFSAGSELDARSLDPLAQRRMTRNVALVTQVLRPCHPVRMLLGLLRQAVPGITQRAETSPAAVIIHFHPDRVIKETLVYVLCRNIGLRRFRRHISRTGICCRCRHSDHR